MKECCIVRLVKEVSRFCVLPDPSAHPVNVQNAPQKCLRLFLVHFELCREQAQFFCHPGRYVSCGLALEISQIQKLKVDVSRTEFSQHLHHAVSVRRASGEEELLQISGSLLGQRLPNC